VVVTAVGARVRLVTYSVAISCARARIVSSIGTSATVSASKPLTCLRGMTSKWNLALGYLS